MNETVEKEIKLNLATLACQKVKVDMYDSVATGLIIGFESQMAQIVFDNEKHLYGNPYMLISFKQILEIL